MSVALLVAGVVVYPLSVGFAARFWLWVMRWDWYHDDEWRINRTVLACGYRWIVPRFSIPVWCPGCKNRHSAWALGAFWPVTMPVGLIALTTKRLIVVTVQLARITAQLARICGPRAPTDSEKEHSTGGKEA